MDQREVELTEARRTMRAHGSKYGRCAAGCLDPLGFREVFPCDIRLWFERLVDVIEYRIRIGHRRKERARTIPHGGGDGTSPQEPAAMA